MLHARPYTRSLDPRDYDFLKKETLLLRLFLDDMVRRGVPHREWHPHRFWEYASILQQMSDFKVPMHAEVIDVGAGASFFDPMLALLYPKLCCTDSMKYGDVSFMVEEQRRAYEVALPLYDLPLEDMSARPEIGWGGATDKFDVTMCISTIEHIDDHDKAFDELVRITRAGGYIFITSDYFKSEAHWDQSISRHLQVTPYTEAFVRAIPERWPVRFVEHPYFAFVGDVDLEYKGDFVHNYSFVNICLQRLP